MNLLSGLQVVDDEEEEEEDEGGGGGGGGDAEAVCRSCASGSFSRETISWKDTLSFHEISQACSQHLQSDPPTGGKIHKYKHIQKIQPQSDLCHPILYKTSSTTIIPTTTIINTSSRSFPTHN